MSATGSTAQQVRALLAGGELEKLPVKAIELDSKFQLRDSSHRDTEELEEVLDDPDAELTPVLVVQIDARGGRRHVLLDGHRRLAAYRLKNRLEIPCRVIRQASPSALIYFASVRANTQHGKRLSNEEKREAVYKAQTEPAFAALSTREAASVLGVSHTLVANVRSEWKNRTPLDDEGREGILDTIEEVTSTMQTAWRSLRGYLLSPAAENKYQAASEALLELKAELEGEPVGPPPLTRVRANVQPSLEGPPEYVPHLPGLLMKKVPGVAAMYKERHSQS